MRTRSATVRMPSFSIIRLRWTLMVFSTVPRSPAICLLSRPATTCVSTSRSRGVRVADLRLDRFHFGMKPARLGVPGFSTGYGFEQILVLYGLGQEIDRAGLHGAHAGRNVAFAGDEHDGTMIAAGGGQHALKLQTIKTRHRNIQYGTAGNGHVVLFEEYLRRRIWLDLIALGAEQSRQRLEDSGVIIDEVDCEFVRHAVPNAGCWTGNENLAMAPPPSSLTSVSLPLMRLYDRRTEGQTQTKAMVLGGVEMARTDGRFPWGECRVRDPSRERPPFRFGAARVEIRIEPLRHRGRDHGIHRIHDKIEQDLLQLHRIAACQKRACSPDQA